MGWVQKWGAGQYGLDELRQLFNLKYSKDLFNFYSKKINFAVD